MIERVLTGLLLTPLAGLVGWLVMFFFAPLAGNTLIAGIFFGSILALPTTCVVIPTADAALGKIELKAIPLALAGYISGTITTGAFQSNHPSALPIVMAGALGGIVVGVLFNSVLRVVSQKPASTESGTT